MLRILCLFVGVVVSITPLVVDALVTEGDLARALLESRGGDKGQGKTQEDCDERSGVYVGCTKAGDVCVQCVQEDNDDYNSEADKLDPDAPKGATGYMDGQESQDCGFIFSGKCIADPQAPNGFDCAGRVTDQICTEGVLEIVPQPVPVDPGNPG